MARLQSCWSRTGDAGVQNLQLVADGVQKLFRMLVDDERLESLSGVDIDVSNLVENLCTIARDGAPDGMKELSNGARSRYIDTIVGT